MLNSGAANLKAIALGIATMVSGIDNHADATCFNIVQNIRMTFANLGCNVNVNAMLLQIFGRTAGCRYDVA